MKRLELARSAGKMAIFLVPTLILLLDVSIAEGASMKLSKSDKKEALGGGGGGGGGGRPSVTTYDQRQTGKYNIHVNIKDVKIISVDGEKFDGEFGVSKKTDRRSLPFISRQFGGFDGFHFNWGFSLFFFFCISASPSLLIVG